MNDLSKLTRQHYEKNADIAVTAEIAGIEYAAIARERRERMRNSQEGSVHD
jgi:hypothetical protein